VIFLPHSIPQLVHPGLEILSLLPVSEEQGNGFFVERGSLEKLKHTSIKAGYFHPFFSFQVFL
jgi:hypothetical protein